MAFTLDETKGLPNRPFGLQRRWGHRGVLVTYPTIDPSPAPIITNVQVSSITPSSALVTWDTDIPATSKVEYDTDGSPYDNEVVDLTEVTSHSLSLSGLTASTLYHYRVCSTANSQQVCSSDDTFSTIALPGSAAFLTYEEFRVDFDKDLGTEYVDDGTGMPMAVHPGGTLNLSSTTPAWSTNEWGHKIWGAQIDCKGGCEGLTDIPTYYTPPVGGKCYTASKNINASLPTVIPAGSTIVFGKARDQVEKNPPPNLDPARPCMDYVAFFNILSSAPPAKAGNDRYIGPVPEEYGSFPKSVDVWDGDVSVFPNLADPSDVSDMPTAQGWLDKMKYQCMRGGQLWTWRETWKSALVGNFEGDQGWYGADQAHHYTTGALMLCYSRYTATEKRDIACRLAYIGKQIYRAYQQGTRSEDPAGGGSSFCQYPIVFYGMLIGDSSVYNYIKNNLSAGPTPPRRLFAAASMFGWIPDSGPLPTVIQSPNYTENCRGMPEYGKSWGDPAGDGKHVAYKWETSGTFSQPYRRRIGVHLVTWALFAHQMAGVAGWDIYDAYNFGDKWQGANGGGWDPATKESPMWDYADRYVKVTKVFNQTDPIFGEVGNGGAYRASWIKAAYEEQRETNPSALPKWTESHADQIAIV